MINRATILHNDYLSANISLECFTVVDPKPLLDSEEDSEGLKPNRLYHWPKTRFALKIIIVGFLGLVQSLQWWLTATDSIRVLCHISGQDNSTYQFVGQVCNWAIVESRGSTYKHRNGTVLFQAEQVHHFNQRLDKQETTLQQIRGYLGLDVDVDHDVALQGSGASIIPEFTSPTLTPHHSGLQSWFASVPSSQRPVIQPGVVLEENLVVGECWEFYGQQGVIGIQLPTYTNITAFSINYIPANRLSQHSKQRAPRSITVWGLAQLSQLRESDLSTIETRAIKDFTQSGRVPSGLVKEDVFVPIIKANYNLDLNPRHTVFSDTAEHHSILRNCLYNVVVLEITNNWGANSTCLYHVGIHGTIA
ncbi:hypothetical protein CVT24_002537 [Panaeolus cyanescens]|uniref:SUN domain-containing protein n=1 Tax=Panaeolus cyanescens TaxID=181874 RepID=A0A409WB09_9AGAR|nr:hypothetical protein CVT24_002537 [Panaeolus cyanescens]